MTIVTGQKEIDQDLHALVKALDTIKSLFKKHVQHPDRASWEQNEERELLEYSSKLGASFVFQACLEKHIDILYLKVLPKWFEEIKTGEKPVDYRELNRRWLDRLLPHLGFSRPSLPLTLCFCNTSTCELIFAKAERVYLGHARKEFAQGWLPFERAPKGLFFCIEMATKPVSLAEFATQQGLF